jgi:20S proteasome alpha/beta subunit
MTKDEALKLALEALKRTGNIAGFAHEREQAVITAIDEVLAQPVQEPVGQVGD